MKVLIFLSILLGSFLSPFLGSSAIAGVFELGGSYSYTKKSYPGGNYSWTRSWSASIGYYFTPDSEIEFMYQDSTNKDYLSGSQDITNRDRVSSLNLLYYFFDEKSPIRPFVRGGIGQLNRDASGSYTVSSTVSYSPPAKVDQVTAIMGVGLKLKIGSRFGIKAEMISYMTGGSVSTWKDNITYNVGGSFYF